MIEALIILGLIFINAVLALAETAIVSSQRIRLEQQVREGRRGSRRALALFDDPTRFLSTVQIGITLIGILAGAFAGQSLAESLAVSFNRWEWLAPYGESLAFTLVVLTITYLSLVLGELVPKRLALNNPERYACRLAQPMTLLARLTAPLTSLLSGSTNLLLGLLGQAHKKAIPLGEVDIAGLVKQGKDAGVFEEVEQEIIENVFWFADRPILTLMTPRHDIAWLDLNGDRGKLQQQLKRTSHSYYVVSDTELDQVKGVVSSSDLLLACLDEAAFSVPALMQPPLFFPEAMSALTALETFKQRGTHIALVMDEYGSVEGLLTLRDLLEALVGNIPSNEELEAPRAVQRDDNSWLIDGLLSIDDFRELFDISPLNDDDLEPHATLAGFVVSQLGRIPEPAERFEWSSFQFEVVDTDAGRVDKVLVAVNKDAEQD